MTVTADQQVSKRPGSESYHETLKTLSEGSVRRKFDPYLDIDWDSPDFQVDPDDPRWVLPDFDPLGAHPWYRAQPLEKQIAIGMWRQANVMKVGLQFEAILIRGMMQYAMKLSNGNPEFRYCLHEMTEECNHIQMFQECVNRIGLDVPGARKSFRVASDFIGLGAFRPLGFFMGILAGEEPIDHTQKAVMRSGKRMPEAVQRVMQIHVAEEARHISFAHQYLHHHMPRQNKVDKAVLSVALPAIMRWLADAIMAPPKEFAETFDIPKSVLREAFWKSEHSQQVLAGYFGDVRMLAEDLGLMNPVSERVWKRLGIDGTVSRFRGEPHRPATVVDVREKVAA